MGNAPVCLVHDWREFTYICLLPSQAARVAAAEFSRLTQESWWTASSPRVKPAAKKSQSEFNFESLEV